MSAGPGGFRGQGSKYFHVLVAHGVGISNRLPTRAGRPTCRTRCLAIPTWSLC